ncbi:MAG: hypothetical protein KIT69_08240 [Propionibacteriaceae bacterium]|nr:hypothetical protein [Propionibacteriaceae bacterium]
MTVYEFDGKKGLAAKRALDDSGVIAGANRVQTQLNNARSSLPEMPPGTRAEVAGLLDSAASSLAKARAGVGSVRQALHGKAADLGHVDKISGELGARWKFGQKVVDIASPVLNFVGGDTVPTLVGTVAITSWNPAKWDWQKSDAGKLEKAVTVISLIPLAKPSKYLKKLIKGRRLKKPPKPRPPKPVTPSPGPQPWPPGTPNPGGYWPGPQLRPPAGSPKPGGYWPGPQLRPPATPKPTINRPSAGPPSAKPGTPPKWWNPEVEKPYWMTSPVKPANRPEWGWGLGDDAVFQFAGQGAGKLDDGLAGKNKEKERK